MTTLCTYAHMYAQSDASLIAQQQHQAHTSQVSLTSVGSHEAGEAVRVAKALFDYRVSSLQYTLSMW